MSISVAVLTVSDGVAAGKDRRGQPRDPILDHEHGNRRDRKGRDHDHFDRVGTDQVDARVGQGDQQNHPDPGLEGAAVDSDGEEHHGSGHR